MITVARMNIALNDYQGTSIRALCVCSAGVLRSPTVANILITEFGYNCRAVGWYDAALIRLEPVHIVWADQIWCVDSESHQELMDMVRDNTMYTAHKHIYNLGIDDDFDYMDPQLIDQIRSSNAYRHNLCISK